MKTYLTDPQAKLGALLEKVTDVLPYSSDADCEQAFATLRDLARHALATKESLDGSKYDALDLEDLIALDQAGTGKSGKKTKTPTEAQPPRKRGRSLSPVGKAEKKAKTPRQTPRPKKRDTLGETWPMDVVRLRQIRREYVFNFSYCQYSSVKEVLSISDDPLAVTIRVKEPGRGDL